MGDIRHSADFDRYAWTPPEDALHLPGFVDHRPDGISVTYESHQFWITSGAFAELYVRHGGGVERLTGLRLIARSIRAMAEAGMAREAFWCAWDAFALYREGRAAGAAEEREEHQRAFVEGRLRKRKMPGRDLHRVWIEAPKRGAA